MTTPIHLQVLSRLEALSSASNPDFADKMRSLTADYRKKHLMDDPEWTSLPYMGLIKMTQTQLGDSTDLFNSQIREPNYIQFDLYSAKQHMHTEEIKPVDLLTQVRMTRQQYSELLVSMNGSGSYCTIYKVDGQDVTPYEKERDPSYQRLQILRDRASNPDSFSDNRILNIFSYFNDNLSHMSTDSLKQKELAYDVLHQTIHSCSMQFKQNAASDICYKVKNYSEKLGTHIAGGLLSVNITMSHIKSMHDFSSSEKSLFLSNLTKKGE